MLSPTTKLPVNEANGAGEAPIRWIPKAEGLLNEWTLLLTTAQR